MILKKIFVTGASGFIGSNLVNELTKQGYIVSALLRKNASHPFLEELLLTRIEGDLFSQKILDNAIKKCDAVIHCAAIISFDEKNSRETYHVNITGTNNILKAAMKHNKRVVFVSTASTIGIPQKLPQVMAETTSYSFEERNPYSHSKHIAEKQVLRYVKEGLHATIVNPSTVYGKGDLHGTGALLYGLIEKYPVLIAPPGGCSVVAVQDVVIGIIEALEKGKKGERYILTHENITYQHLFFILRKVIKKSSIPLLRAPPFLGSLAVKTIRALDIPSAIMTPSVFGYLFQFRYLTNQKARNDLSWSPTIPIEQAINEGYLFFVKQKETFTDNGH